MTTTEIWWTIIAIAIIGLALRGAFLILPVLPSALSPTARRALDLVPAAALGALIAPAVLRPDGSLGLHLPELAGAAAAIAVGVRWRNSALTIGTGLAVYALVALVT